MVKKIAEENGELEELTPEIKKSLTKILSLDLSTSAGTTPINNCLTRLCQSLVRSLESGEANLDFPLSPLPMELEIL